MKKIALFSAFLLCASIQLAASAQAATVGASLTLSDVDGDNFADLLLTNISTSARITDFSLTIGNTDFGFDRFLVPLAECGTSIATCNLISPDNIQNNIGEPLIDMEFTGFDPAELLTIQDIDVDFASGSASDFDPNNKLDVILFNNGPAVDNAVFSVTFSSGEVLAMVLPDGPDSASYTFELTAVPVPAAMWLFVSGLVGLVGMARNKSRA